MKAPLGDMDLDKRELIILTCNYPVHKVYWLHLAYILRDPGFLKELLLVLVPVKENVILVMLKIMHIM